MNRFIAILLLAVPLVFTACSDDDDYPRHPDWADNGGNGGNHGGGGGNNGITTGPLNQYEQTLVGSYVSDDDPAQPFYLVLNSDRTGNYKSVSNGQTTGEGFIWCANDKELTVQYDSDGSYATMEYYYANNHLYVDGIPLVVNTGGGEVVQNPLVGQWQGTINGYYSAVWGQADDNFTTVMEFTDDGMGCQLDYNEYSPKSDYAYTPFTWTQAGDVITITYQTDSDLSAARISNYALTSAKFTGQIAYGDKTFTFRFDTVTGFDWSPYQGTAVEQAKAHIRMLRKAKAGTVRKGSFEGIVPKVP